MKDDYKFRAIAAQAEFFRNIKAANAGSPIKDSEIARKAGISPSHYSMMKSGKRPLTLESMVRISNALDLEINLTFI